MASSTVTSASSSTTLWATPSKEWVIQPKPKPGRKPKKDADPGDKGDTEENGKGRKIQNRAAQRAFRERKQSQLAELQARLQLYEQGEVERSIAIQNVAKRLKDENEKLRQENQALQEKLARLEALQAQHANEFEAPPVSHNEDGTKKRWREAGPSPTPRSSSPPLKRSRVDGDEINDVSQDVLQPVVHLPSPASMVSTPDAGGQDLPFPNISYDSPTNYDNKVPDPLNAFSSFGCGLCTDGGLCVCRQIISEETLSSSAMSTNPPSETPTTTTQQPSLAPPLSSSSVSILDNLPEYKPPVPLRRRQHARPIAPVFRVVDISASAPTCSGDPSNCLACADDSFGKAFCSAIGDSARGCGSCSDCPNKFGCGMGDQCCQVVEKHPPAPPPNEVSSSSSPPINSEGRNDGDKMIPTNDAWRQIKAHPNVEFADLALLADVVASRTTCPGPRFLFAPQPGPANTSGSATLDASYTQRQADRSPPPMLVPQDILVECGRRNMRHVHKDGVREALRLLDAKFS